MLWIGSALICAFFWFVDFIYFVFFLVEFCLDGDLVTNYWKDIFVK